MEPNEAKKEKWWRRKEWRLWRNIKLVANKAERNKEGRKKERKKGRKKERRSETNFKVALEIKIIFECQDFEAYKTKQKK